MHYKTKHVGVGGIRCKCCTRGPSSLVKRWVNREQRRKAKQNTKAELN